MAETDRIDARIAKAAAAFFKRAEAELGADHVRAGKQENGEYSDIFAFDPARHAPSGAVMAQSVQQVQALVRLANETGCPLWPISRGRNYGYGGAAPVLRGSVVLDLSPMNKIIEIDVDRGYCIVEPGVGFFDLYARLQAMGMPLWMSVPGQALGSVAGNALERGMGPQPYGNHSAQICGMEIVLPDGQLLRTGSGAMANSKTAHVTHNSYGPSWDQMFCQSNFGVVTSLGFWLMPAPEATMTLNLSLPEADDLARGVDMLYPLRQRALLDHDVAWVSYVGIASYVHPRAHWYQGTGLLPEAVGQAIRKELGLGWWNAQVNFYGPEAVIRARCDHVKAALQPHFPAPLQEQVWRQGDPFENSRAGIPSTRDMAMINWHGGRGGHLGFSPILPADGKQALAQFKRARQRYDEANIDYYGAFSVGGRSVVSINEILYNKDDPAMASAVPTLMTRLIEDAAAQGYGEYRTHIDDMEMVAETFDYNDHALWKLNMRFKDMIDPGGILAPGKQGIWPRRFRA